MANEQKFNIIIMQYPEMKLVLGSIPIHTAQLLPNTHIEYAFVVFPINGTWTIMEWTTGMNLDSFLHKETALTEGYKNLQKTPLRIIKKAVIDAQNTLAKARIKYPVNDMDSLQKFNIDGENNVHY